MGKAYLAMTDDLLAYMPAVGDSFRMDYGQGNRANKLIHVRAIVDGEYIVYRYRRGFEWVYKMTDPTFFLVNTNGEVMSKVKGRNRAGDNTDAT